MAAAPDPLERESITFENGLPVEILHVRQAISVDEVLQALGIPPAQAAIIVAGSTTPFQPRLKNRLLDLLSRGVAQAALECGAILLDQGTKDGVSRILGQGVADRGRRTALIGVTSPTKTDSPGAPVTKDGKNLDPNHTHFIINEQERQGWQAEMLCRLAEATTSNKDWIMTVLVGGETNGEALDLTLEAVRRGWNLVVIDRSGPLANQIVKLKKKKRAVEKRRGSFWRRINRFSVFNPMSRLQERNPRLYEIISDGDIMIVGTSFDAIQLRNLIKGTFTHPPKENILWTAWRRFAEYDLNSIRHRNWWRRLKDIPLYLGAISTLLVLIYSTADINNATLIEGDQNQLWIGLYTSFMGFLSRIRNNQVIDLIFRFLIIMMPISSSIILSAETRLKLGSKYILLRGAAESVKRGIYSYRVLGQQDEKNREVLLPHDEKGLAAHLAKVNKILLDSDVNEAAFAPYGGPIPPNMFGAAAHDDGFSTLDPEKYVKIRIGDQLEFYTLRTNQYEKKIRRLQIWMLLFGGLGTFLAAVGAQYWLPLTAAIVSAATAFLEYQQLEQTLMKYNLTKSSLENVRANWLAMSEDERTYPQKVQELVQEVEAILESENQGWVQYITQVQEVGKEGKTPSK